MARTNKIEVCYVSTYNAKYVRTRFLLATLGEIDRVRVYEALSLSKNKIVRYFSPILQVLKIRITKNPDVYLLGFRGYEAYWPVRFITIGKPLIFDEFINLSMWVGDEHDKVKADGAAHKAIRAFGGWQLKTSQAILTDTAVNAEYSSNKQGVDVSKYHPIYVGTDENVFTDAKTKTDNEKLEVFMYGTILPLHGIDVVFEAVLHLNDNVHLTFVGSTENKARQQELDGRVEGIPNEKLSYLKWVDFEKLPNYINKADLCLGGPFGGTTQANLVISGKTFQFISSAKPTVVGEIKDSKAAGFVDRENCLLVKQGSAKELAKAINWAAENKPKLPTIGKKSAELYKNQFSVKAQKDKLDALLESLTQ